MSQNGFETGVPEPGHRASECPAPQAGDCNRCGNAKAQLPQMVEELLQTLKDRGTVDHVCTYPLPRQDVLVHVVTLLSRLLFPGYLGEKAMARENLLYHLGEMANAAFEHLCAEIAKCLLWKLRDNSHEARDECARQAQEHALHLLFKLPALSHVLDDDVRAAYMGDPAATGNDEVIICYPGFRAVLIHRIAHELHLQGVPLMPRMMTEYAHQITGIDIHPGATIGRNFFIDHGTGVVIGETTQIGDNVKTYQGVTLGALSFPTEKNGTLKRGFKRHPTIEDDVVIYSNATILGDVVIGRGSVIGGNVFLTESVPPNTRVTRQTRDLKIRRNRE